MSNDDTKPFHVVDTFELLACQGAEEFQVSLKVIKSATGYALEMHGPHQTIETFSDVDWEEATAFLRDELRSRGMRLGCNRFRKGAFTSGMCRSMSEGLMCYLPKTGWGRFKRGMNLVDSFVAAPLKDVS